MPESRSRALPRQQIKLWWGTNKDTTNTTYETTDTQTKKNCNGGTTFRTVSRIPTCFLGGFFWWGGGGERVPGLWLVLLSPYIALNSDAAPNYKYMFGPHRFLYLICETWQKHCDETNQRAQSSFHTSDVTIYDADITRQISYISHHYTSSFELTSVNIMLHTLHVRLHISMSYLKFIQFILKFQT